MFERAPDMDNFKTNFLNGLYEVSRVIDEGNLSLE